VNAITQSPTPAQTVIPTADESALVRYYGVMDGSVEGELFDLLSDEFQYTIDGVTGGRSEYMALRADYKQHQGPGGYVHEVRAVASSGPVEVLLGRGFVTTAEIAPDGRLRRIIVFHLADVTPTPL
jgi:hypothetical protein